MQPQPAPALHPYLDPTLMQEGEATKAAAAADLARAEAEWRMQQLLARQEQLEAELAAVKRMLATVLQGMGV